VSRDADGYARRAYQSDGKVWTFPRDVREFLSVEDDRLFFIDGVNREMEPIMKWMGEDICEDLLDGFTVNIGEKVAVSYHGSLATRIAGGRRLRKVWSCKPFYPVTMMPEEDDCYGVQARGERLVKTILENRLPLKLSSCGSILSSMEDLPIMRYPRAVAEMAYNCYHGGWIEALQLGRFEDAYDYDLSSAYPTEISRLLSCGGRMGSWYQSREFIQSAEYGFCYCTIRLDVNLPLSPLMLRIRSYMSRSGRIPIRSVRNPVGAWEGWMTKDEIVFVVSNYLGEVEIEDGWWFIPSSYRRPFEKVVAKLGRLRKDTTKKGDWLGGNLGKIIAATIQGKMIQSYINRGVRVSGNAFNPVYAATITSRVRLKVAEAALENYDDVLMIMVDGLLTSSPIAVPKQWKMAHKGDCVVATHGGYDIPGRATLNKFFGTLEESQWDTTYRLNGARYESLAEALEGGSFEMAGRRIPEVRAKVSAVGKRLWDDTPKVCNDLLTKQYKSAPPMASMSIIRNRGKRKGE